MRRRDVAHTRAIPACIANIEELSVLIHTQHILIILRWKKKWSWKFNIHRRVRAGLGSCLLWIYEVQLIGRIILHTSQCTLSCWLGFHSILLCSMRHRRLRPMFGSIFFFYAFYLSGVYDFLFHSINSILIFKCRYSDFREENHALRLKLMLIVKLWIDNWVLTREAGEKYTVCGQTQSNQMLFPMRKTEKNLQQCTIRFVRGA